MSVQLVGSESQSRFPGLIQAGECMGEIRVDVKLSNGVDDVLARSGDLPASKVRQCDVSAIVDTGAVRCCIPEPIAHQLGVGISGHTVATFADGRQETVAVTNPIRVEINGRGTFQVALVVGDEFLIGQLALEDTDMWADCKGRRLVPNPAHPDEPVFRV